MSAELALALLIMVVGVVGSAIPFIPGPPLIWLGAFFYAFTTDFVEVGPITLGLLFVIMLISVSSDIWVNAMRQRKSGASVAATILSPLLGLVGLFTLGLPGMLIGSIVGAVLPDYARYRDMRRMFNLSVQTIVSWLISAAVQVGLGIVMIAIFLAVAL
jgi:uncharacterized protein YqgC (DUF456 family)